MRRPALALLLAAAGCAAGARGGRPEYVFPPAFEANQVVTVRTGAEVRELLASLRRDGDDLRVTLFDPALAAPLLSASRLAGRTRVEPLAGGAAAAAEAPRLLELLGALHGRTFAPREDGSAEAKAGRVVFRLRGLRARDGCLFPDRVEIAPRAGTAFHVEVVTIDVACRAPGRPAG